MTLELIDEIDDVARLMRMRFDRFAGAHNMTRAELIILIHLARIPGLSQVELAAQPEVETVSALRSVYRMEARGLLERRQDTADRRLRRLYLLPSAMPILAKLEYCQMELRRGLAEGLDGSTWEAVGRALRYMKSKFKIVHAENAIVPGE